MPASLASSVAMVVLHTLTAENFPSTFLNLLMTGVTLSLEKVDEVFIRIGRFFSNEFLVEGVRAVVVVPCTILFF